jgi:hypothetical protein
MDGYDWIFRSLVAGTDFFYAQYGTATHDCNLLITCVATLWVVDTLLSNPHIA